MTRAFELMLAEVHRYEGTVNQFLGDGIMALFGALAVAERQGDRALLLEGHHPMWATMLWLGEFEAARRHFGQDEKWFSGLPKFFADDWKGALEDIKAADRLQPEFPDLQRLMAEAADKIKNPPPRPFPWRPVGGVMALLMVGAVAVVGTRRARWNRLRITPADLLRLSSRGTPPVLLDVRDPVLYSASPYRMPGRCAWIPTSSSPGWPRKASTGLGPW